MERALQEIATTEQKATILRLLKIFTAYLRQEPLDQHFIIPGVSNTRYNFFMNMPVGMEKEGAGKGPVFFRSRRSNGVSYNDGLLEHLQALLDGARGVIEDRQKSDDSGELANERVFIVSEECQNLAAGLIESYNRKKEAKDVSEAPKEPQAAEVASGGFIGRSGREIFQKGGRLRTTERGGDEPKRRI